MDKTIRHFEALQKRYMTQHNGTACEHVARALDALRQADEIAALRAENAAYKALLDSVYDRAEIEKFDEITDIIDAALGKEAANDAEL